MFQPTQSDTRLTHLREFRWKGAAEQVLAGLLLTLPVAGPTLASTAAHAQTPAQTTVHDTIRNADGSAAQGTLLLSWTAFTAADGTSVPAGSTSVLLDGTGTFTLALVPNAGGTPIGSFYTAVYHLADGTTSREYWQVPVSASPVTLQNVRTSVLPTSVAVQTVSKQYVDQAIARAAFGGGSGSGAVLATSSSQGTVQLGPGATRSVLANVATSGLASDLGGTLNAAQMPALTGMLPRPPVRQRRW